MYVDRARSEIDKAAARLGQITAEAAQAGAFDETITIARWAAALADLTGSPPPGANLSPATVSRSAAPRRVASKSPPPASSTTRYPRFERRGDELIKVAWSRAEGKEYEQRAPRSVLDRLVKEFSRRATGGAPVATESLLPMISPEDGREVPSYQVYVALAWLRERNLVQAVGRKGYQVSAPERLRGQIDMDWNAIPERKR